MTASVLPISLRILQRLSAGGERGVATLLAVKHAGSDKSGRAGSYSQLGVPMGMLMSSGDIALMAGVISPGEAFMEWNWRVPFLLSVVFTGVGYWVRRSVEDIPVFKKFRLNLPSARH